MSLTGKVVVVTGGSGGIGEAIGALFARNGAAVVLSSRDANRAEAARQRVGHTERSLALACDVRNLEDIERTVALTLDRFQRIDVWINNAGFGLHDSVAAMDMSVCRDLFETNFFGALNGMKAAIPVMTRQGSGTIVNISSVAGHIPLPGGAAYSASKFALNAIGKAARIELRKSHINVLTVCPGIVQTEFSAHMVGERSRRAPRRFVQRITADHVARAVLAGYLKNRREVIVPWTMIPAVKLYQVVPGLLEWALLRRS
jgi:short-subunit dehydrogenase